MSVYVNLFQKGGRFLCFLLLGIGFVLAGYTPVPQAKAEERQMVLPPAACPLHTESKGRLIQEDWSTPLAESGNEWQGKIGMVSGFNVTNWLPGLSQWSLNEGVLYQNNITNGQVNLLFEPIADIADGVIETCMRLPSAPTSTAVFPHGVVFRVSHNQFTGETSGIGVGFIQDNLLALGYMVDNQIAPQPVDTAIGFLATEWTRFKIVLQGNQIKVFVAQGETPYTASPTLEGTISGFTEGKVGFATYAVQGDFPLSQ